MWDSSFCNITHNLKATSKRGWHPCNQKLLSHPDLENDLQSQATITDITDRTPDTTELPQLNFTLGFAGECIQRLLQEAMRNDGIQKRRQKLGEGETVWKNIEEAKRITSGVLVSNGEHVLGQRVCDIINRNEQVKIDEANRKKWKKQQELIQKIKEVKKI